MKISSIRREAQYTIENFERVVQGDAEVIKGGTSKARLFRIKSGTRMIQEHKDVRKIIPENDAALAPQTRAISSFEEFAYWRREWKR